MGMNRRSFLGLLGIAPVAITAAPAVVEELPQLLQCATSKIGETIQVKKPMRFAGTMESPSLRLIRHYDVSQDRMISRFDAQWGLPFKTDEILTTEVVAL